MVARYAHGFDPAWFYIHITVQILGFACIVAGVATGIELAKDLKPNHSQAHRGLGLFLLVLVVLQVLYSKFCFRFLCNCSKMKTVFRR
jgi:uncharacterized membrane protein